ncbi:MAG: SDR family NAD(P)-dependent oxidoreductase [Thermoleophilaceae bacterium]|nr:SDR family NAD(P)-dependent oxidoreductase [Thermoleophilaceae bacterium]
MLVTGSNRGIGREIVEALATRETHVLAGMRDTSAFERVGGARAREVTPVRIDLSSKGSIEECVAGLGGRRVDVLVNNAGRFAGGLFEEGDVDEYYDLVQVNFAGLVHLTRRLLRPMLEREHGKIVNNASIAGYAHFPGAAVYSGSKAAVVGFSEALRRELAESPVGVLQVVTPGVETSMLAQVRRDYDEHVGDTSKLDGVDPGEWAGKVVDAIESDAEVLNPGGMERLAKLASRGPAALLDTVLGRAFDR